MRLKNQEYVQVTLNSVSPRRGCGCSVSLMTISERVVGPSKLHQRLETLISDSPSLCSQIPWQHYKGPILWFIPSARTHHPKEKSITENQGSGEPMDTEHIINPARELLSNLSVTAFNILGQAVQ